MTIADVLETQFRILPCDFCRDRRNKLVYTDPQTKQRFCLDCLESGLEDILPELPALPEDPAGEARLAAAYARTHDVYDEVYA